MRVLFWYRGSESIGIEYLSAYLKQAGHETALAYDPAADDPLYFHAPALRPLNRYDRLWRLAEDFRPDLFAVSSLTSQYRYLRDAALECKRRFPCVPTIVGGSHPTMVPEHVIADPAWDMLCSGEGEDALLDVVHALERGASVRDIPNVWSKDAAGAVHRNEPRPIVDDLDKFPWMDKDPWFAAGTFKDIVFVPTGRGCPFKCSFCEAHVLQRVYTETGKGRLTRKRGVANLLRELKHWRDRYDPKFIHFIDPTFNVDHAWMREFLPAYEKHMERFPFLCQLVVPGSPPDLIAQLASAGCKMVYVGLDAGNEEFRSRVLHRDFRNTDAVSLARELRRRGVEMHLSSIFGTPGETPEMMDETLRLIDQIRPDMLSAYIMYPYPGTDLTRNAIAAGYLAPETAEAINEGVGNFHAASLFKHAHAAEAESFSRLAPAYNKMPARLRPAARRLARTGRLGALLKLFYLASLPLLFKITGRTMVKDFVRT
ncbi:MAG: B12-binding domain-containing radical SAM protein, partial [Candidatus Methylomirabilis sp.]|nr:B12-binding domain-containing radical SAM protein [Deltaproteobacteria bacterium]